MGETDAMRARLKSLGRHGTEGAATLEYAAAVALAALFVGAIVVTFSGLRIEAIAERAICSVKAILGGSSCSASQGNQPPTTPPLDPKPKKCKITEHSEKVNSEIKIAFIKIGENAGFIETTYSDGTVTYTATDGAEVGLTGGFGGKLDIGKLERGVKVDFGAGVSVRVRQYLGVQECRGGRRDARAARQIPCRAGDASARHQWWLCDLSRDTRRDGPAEATESAGFDLRGGDRGRRQGGPEPALGSRSG